jgi:iron complex outermembrane receptor protein
MKFLSNALYYPLVLGSSLNATAINAEIDQSALLEEVLVTAQRREQDAQDTPIAMTVLSSKQLNSQRIHNLSDLATGTASSLRIMPWSNTPTTLVLAIRGNGPGDPAQATRDGSVAVYVDDVYLSRAQGLAMEFADVERIEVLQGPQGTLFGRNATGGAVSIVSRKPTGTLDIEQTFGVGRFDERRSVTHVNLPEVSGLRSKIDYFHAQRDGWVKNTAPDQEDYNAYLKQGGKVSLDWQASKTVNLWYAYENSQIDASQNYFQVLKDFGGALEEEQGRQSSTRFPINPLELSITKHTSHNATASWEISDTLTLKSISAYRELDDEARNNYGGSAYFNGFIEEVDRYQTQWSQELRLTGTNKNISWVAGVFHFEEDTDETIRTLYSLDLFGIATGTALTPLSPPTNIDYLVTGTASPQRRILADTSVSAVYGTLTWIPESLNQRLKSDIGFRYSKEEKSGQRVEGGAGDFDIESENLDPSIILSYQWLDQVTSYVKWSSAYRAGGVNSRSETLTPFEEERVNTTEIGLKSEWMDQRIRFNASIFSTDYEDMFIDAADPSNISVVETINAEKDVNVEGLEFTLTTRATDQLSLTLNYTYLDGNMPLQPNYLEGGELQSFALTQTPRHAGSLSVDYTFKPTSFGRFKGHFDAVSTSPSHYFPDLSAPGDSYTLFNVSLALTGIPVGAHREALEISAWAKNITDEEYRVNGFNFPGALINAAYGEPRTAGVDVAFKF